MGSVSDRDGAGLHWRCLPVCVATVALFVMGCSSQPEYPAGLAFPARNDRLVLQSPERVPTGLNAPGKLEAELEQLDELGGRTLNPATVTTEARSAIDHALKESFGTPSSPHLSDSPSTVSLLRQSGLTPEKLLKGGKLYRKHCQNCHGLTGDARGPTGLWLNPYPRDYRRGQFKFLSTGEKRKPSKSDLLRTVTEGLKGSAMPAFGLLPDAERELLVGYVIYLAVRGETEFQSLVAAAEGRAENSTDISKMVNARAETVQAEWELAQANVPLGSPLDDGEPGTESHASAVRRGFELFSAKTKESCITCHGDYGRKPLLRFDTWGTVAQPANFTEPHLKGGTRPIDVYHRVRGGIAAVGMPAHPELSDRQVWDLVRFVKAAPYPRELPSDVRAVVYPNP